MSLALSSTVPTWPRRGLWLVLAGVLVAHLGLLGGLPWAAVDMPLFSAPLTLHMRVLQPPPVPIPKAAQPVPRIRPAPRAAPPPLTTAAAEPSVHSDSFALQTTAATGQSATETVARQEPTPSAEAPAAPPEPPAHYAFPPPVRLNYDVDYATPSEHQVASAELLWQHDEANYQASLRVTKFLILMRQWTSRGALTTAGLAPARFGDKGFRRSETAAHFVREDNKVVFSANSPEVSLLPGAQDHLSVFVQLASLWAGTPQRFAAGDSISLQSIGPRQAETWTFVVSAEESITVPGGALSAVKLTREPSGEYSTRAELWLAPQLAYLPARIRLTEGRDNVLDMVWTGSQAP